MAASNRGRIFPHQRDATFDGNVLGDEIEISADHTLATHDVEQHTITVVTKRKHRNKIKTIYEYWEKEFPEYARIGVKKLTKEELNDPTMFWWKNKKDLVYSGLNTKFLKFFLSKKIKEN